LITAKKPSLGTPLPSSGRAPLLRLVPPIVHNQKGVAEHLVRSQLRRREQGVPGAGALNGGSSRHSERHCGASCGLVVPIQGSDGALGEVCLQRRPGRRPHRGLRKHHRTMGKQQIMDQGTQDPASGLRRKILLLASRHVSMKSLLSAWYTRTNYLMLPLEAAGLSPWASWQKRRPGLAGHVVEHAQHLPVQGPHDLLLVPADAVRVQRRRRIPRGRVLPGEGKQIARHILYCSQYTTAARHWGVMLWYNIRKGSTHHGLKVGAPPTHPMGSSTARGEGKQVAADCVEYICQYTSQPLLWYTTAAHHCGVMMLDQLAGRYSTCCLQYSTAQYNTVPYSTVPAQGSACRWQRRWW